MRLLVTGASGLLGLNLALESARTHQVVGVARGTMRSAPIEMLQAELTNHEALWRVFEEARPDAVVHCAAMANVDECERSSDLAWHVNAELPQEIAAICADRGLRLAHISTDAVFDGEKSGSYSEEDLPDPRGVYAETKRAAEKMVLETDPDAIVARVNFYGWSASGKRSIGEFFANNLRAQRPVRGFADVTFCPLLVNQLAQVLLRMVELDLHGLFHVVGPQAMTKLAFGVAIAREFGFDERLITPASVDQSDLPAHRSHNLNLSIHKISTVLGQPLPDFSTGLTQFHAQYDDGYPQRLQGYQAKA